MGWKKKQTHEEDLREITSFSQDEVYEILSGNSTDAPIKGKGSSKEIWKYIAITAAVVAVIAVAIVGVGMIFEKKHQEELAEAAKKEPKEGMTYFLAEQEEAEKSETELTAIISQACYTKDGSLAVYFSFANGMEKDQRLNSVEVKIRNGNDEEIASGYSDAIDDSFIIEADDTKDLLLYISPEYVKIADDPLSTLTYDITTNYEPVD